MSVYVIESAVVVRVEPDLVCEAELAALVDSTVLSEMLSLEIGLDFAVVSDVVVEASDILSV